MSCRHECVPCYGWPSHGYYHGPSIREPDWFERGDWPARRRVDRRSRPLDPERETGSLEARLDDLHAELQRIEATLAELRRPTAEAPERGPGAEPEASGRR